MRFAPLCALLMACQANPSNGPVPGGGDTVQAGVTAPLVRIEDAPAGEGCPAGGISIQAGVDNDNDGVLGDAEVEERFVVCNGADGADGADGAKGEPGDPGDDGPQGERGDTGDKGETGDPGVEGAQGPDGADGIDGEDGDNGLDGEDGIDGDDGLTALIRLDPEPPGERCPGGGVVVHAGLDANRDGELADGEITETEVVCHGRDGQGEGGGGAHTLIEMIPVDPGLDCPAGGLLIQAGPDLDEDGELDPDEIVETAFVCHASLCDSPAFHDPGDGTCVPVERGCLEGFHDGGDGRCVPADQCAEGFHDGGDGRCVVIGDCAEGYRANPNGDGSCVEDCEEGEQDGGDGVCVPAGQCSEGFHDGGDGRCVPIEQGCLDGFRDGGDGACVPEGECSRRYIDVNGVCVVDDRILFDFESHGFTTCGLNGRQGPDRAQCQAAYEGADFVGEQDLFDVVDGVQRWTVPGNGTYRIEARGAQGGPNHVQDPGGRGARIIGDFELAQGDVLNILVGHQGVLSPQGNSANGGSGGGGGSFVWIDGAAQPLIAAGGGGGSGLRNNGDPNYLGRAGVTGPDGTSARDNQGQGGVDGGDAPNGGGRGWLSVRDDGTGAERMNNYGGDGGFGGGGGGGWGLAGNNQHSSGGGGGYSGGGICSQNYYAGGGGGSYNTGENRDDADGENEGHGSVIITGL